MRLYDPCRLLNELQRPVEQSDIENTPVTQPVDLSATTLPHEQEAQVDQLERDEDDSRSDRAGPWNRRRGLLYLAICLIFAAALVLPNLLSTGTAAPAPPCAEGAAIARAAVLQPTHAGTKPVLLAVVRPPAFPNVAPGNEPGCDALYRSDDNGLTWTVSFSATAEAPNAIGLTTNGTLYLLTQRVSFPLYLAGNLYRSDQQGAGWTWNRISPQGRSDVPMVALTNMLVTDDGTIVLRAGNGDGAALLISRDDGVTWQPLVIPQLISVGSVAAVQNQIAVALPLLTPDQAPGLVSTDHGATWQPMGRVPNSPRRLDLRPLLSASDVERVLVLDLVPNTVIGPGGSIARYVSNDGGLHWIRVRCGKKPAPGCAEVTRWASAAGTRYVLFHGHIYSAAAGSAWKLLPARLPVPSSAVLQVLAAAKGERSSPYLVTAAGIWRWDGTAWQYASTGLLLGAPAPTTG